MQSPNIINEFKVKKDFSKFKEVFLEQNSILNLISKNEEKFIYEKHIYDSLALKLFIEKYKIRNESSMLDIGTGGGFPAVPVALEYPKLQVFALDSIRKKINAIENIKKELNINNLETMCDRAENIKGQKFDIITSRAVAPIYVLLKYVAPLLDNLGYFVAYKSKKSQNEVDDAKYDLKKFGIKYIDCIDYSLPLDEVYERKLLVFNKLNK